MSFEKEYYESPAFWSGNMVSDRMNSIRIEETIKMLPADVTSLLDVGCGNGKFLNKLLEENSKLALFGTDRSIEALQYVKTNKFVSDISKIEKEDGFAECTSCLQVLEHIHDTTYEKSLSELARVSSKYILISVPYKEDLQNSFTECPKCLSSFSKELHLRSYNDKSISDLFSKLGFELISQNNVVKGKEYLGIQLFKNIKGLFLGKKKETFKSPICIVCGYKPEEFQTNTTATESIEKNGSSIINFIKQIWPKGSTNGYWIIALYKKSNY